MCGIILLIIPLIPLADSLFLSFLKRKNKTPFTDFQKTMFRTGRDHAGIFIILSLMGQILIDEAAVNIIFEWIMRVGFVLAALLIASGFFAAAMDDSAQKPNKLIVIRYAGSGILMASLFLLGIGLLMKAQ